MTCPRSHGQWVGWWRFLNLNQTARLKSPISSLQYHTISWNFCTLLWKVFQHCSTSQVSNIRYAANSISRALSINRQLGGWSGISLLQIKILHMGFYLNQLGRDSSYRIQASTPSTCLKVMNKLMPLSSSILLGIKLLLIKPSLHARHSLLLKTTPGGKYCIYPHFIDKNTELRAVKKLAQVAKLACLQSWDRVPTVTHHTMGAPLENTWSLISLSGSKNDCIEWEASIETKPLCLWPLCAMGLKLERQRSLCLGKGSLPGPRISNQIRVPNPKKSPFTRADAGEL